MADARSNSDQDRNWNPDDLHELIHDLDEALAAEEAHVAGESGLIEATTARLIAGKPGRYQYRYGFGSRPKTFRAGTAVWMKRGKEKRRATIVSHTRSEIRIEVEEELSAPPLEWKFRRDVGFLYQVVRRRLAELWPRDRRSSADEELIRGLLCGADIMRAKPIENPDVAGLNEAQAHAVRSACTRRVTFLFGPPGTGKSETLAVLVRELVRAGRSVLVVAMTNKAADVIAGRIAGHLVDEPAFDRGLVQRPGYPEPELRGRWGDRLIPDEILSRLRAERYAAEQEGAFLSERAATLARLQATIAPIADARLTECISRSGACAATRARSLEKVARTPLPRGVGDAQVVVTTIHQLVLNREISPVDTVIIDEAGQVSVPYALIASALARSAVVVAGDPRQLGPTLSSNDPDVRRVLGTDLFHASGVLTSGTRALTHLFVQHRMAPEISRLVSEFGYAGKLVCAPNVLIRTPSRIRRELGSLLWLDTGPLAARAARAGGSRVNATHASLVRGLIDDLHRRGFVEDGTGVAVLSPYRAQVVELDSRLRETGCSATTIHAAQGDEREICLLDLVDADGLRLGHFMRATSLEDDGARLLTVGSSRAREVLVVIGSFAHLLQNGGPAIRMFIDALQKHGRPYDLEQKAAA